MSRMGFTRQLPRRSTVIGRMRRNTELGLILLAVIVTGCAYVLASLAGSASLPANIGPFLVVILGLILAAHVANRRLAPNADGMLLPVAALLNGLGYVFIARLDVDLAGLQATWTALGIVGYIATLLVVRRTRTLERYRYTFMAIGIALLIIPLVPGIGREINGARIWASLGPVNFQPGEFAKIALAVFFAGYLVEKRELLAMTTWRIGPVMLPDPKHLGPVMVAWGVSLLVMVAEKDLGSSLLFFALFIVMLWVATERAAYLIVGFSLFAVGAWAAWTQFAHVQQRVTIWLDPWKDFDGDGFQVAQAMFAFGWGGVTGTGIGLGSQVRIPARETDFIFAVVGEELGLLGASVIIMSYLLMVGAGLRVALRAENAFEKLLATGLTTLIGVQAFIIIGGVTRLLPLTGITLPFVSYGGSSLVANYVLLALLIRISDQQTRRVAEVLEAQKAPTGSMDRIR
jgi:peptidoglycan glycosyltransferase